jgi:hypothetical protein
MRGKERRMASNRTLFGFLAAVLAAAVGGVAFGAAQASASSAPIVIPYAKTCDETRGYCKGDAGIGGMLEMQVTSVRASGKVTHLTFTEKVTVGTISFTVELSGHATPAGFIVLNGTVTEGSYAGAQVHQRSNFVSLVGTESTWTGELRLMPGSA